MRILRFFITVFITFLYITSPLVFASSANLSNSYKSDTIVTAGSLVSLDSSKSGFIVPANNQDSQNLLGVVVTSTQSLLAINSTTGNVQVALSGSANALVSTINGNIGVGDEIGVSPIDGVGMEAMPGTRIIGIAQANLTNNSSNVKYIDVTNKSGVKSKVTVGNIFLTIAIGTAPVVKSSGNSNNPIQKLASSIIGHSVSIMALVIGAAIAVVALVAVVTLIYGTIRGSLISIGRNPLAKQAIFETMAQVIGMVCLIVFGSIIIIYLILYSF